MFRQYASESECLPPIHSQTAARTRRYQDLHDPRQRNPLQGQSTDNRGLGLRISYGIVQILTSPFAQATASFVPSGEKSTS